MQVKHEFLLILFLYSENQQFLKEIVNSVLEGEGIGWFKLPRLRKLMEDENYRNLVVSSVNKNSERRIGPDDHIEDCALSKQVYKGMLKLLSAMIHGLEQSYFHNGIGGMASAFSALEIAHTHYWAKERESNKDESSVATTASVSQTNSPYDSGEDVHKLGDSYSPSPETIQSKTLPASSGNISITPSPDAPEMDDGQLSSSAVKVNPITRIASIDSESSEVTSEAVNNIGESTASITVNPSFFNIGNRLSQHLARSTYSDSELDTVSGIIFLSL